MVYADGEAMTLYVSSYQASRIGRFMAAVGRFLRTNDIKHLKPFLGKRTRDKGGNYYPFETDPNALYRLALSDSDSFEQIYRIVI